MGDKVVPESRADHCLLLCKNILTGVGRELAMNGGGLMVTGFLFPPVKLFKWVIITIT